MGARGRNTPERGLRALLRRARAGGGRKRRKSSGTRFELGLIGIDVAGGRSRVKTRNLVPLVLVALFVALGMAALRIDLLRIRYALADSLEHEQRLLDERAELKLRKRQLRDPVLLAERARSLGFVRPERLIDLPAASAPPGAAKDEPARYLADIAAGPAPALLGRP